MKINAKIQSLINSAMASIKTARQNVHDALILAVLDGYKHNQTFSIAWILNNLENVQGSFRVQAVVYWLEEVAGFIVDNKDGLYTVKMAKRGTVSSTFPGIVFNRQASNIASCQDENHRFWKIVPKERKVLRAPELDKAFVGVEAVLARGLALNKFSDADIQLQVSKIVQHVLDKVSSEKTTEWVQDYYTQNPEEKPIEVELTEAEKGLAYAAKLEADAELDAAIPVELLTASQEPEAHATH